MQTSFTFANILEPYQQVIEQALRENIDPLGEKDQLKKACEYALFNGGKRFRPGILLMITKALGHQFDASQAAVGVEFFHTASLIADDLPSMDNDDMRRDKPSLHRVFGESTALLATYALIAAGYACIAKNASSLKNSPRFFGDKSDDLCILAIENVSHNIGIAGASGGQYLTLAPSDFSFAMIKKVIDKKTVALFEMSFVLGWLFGGGDLTLLDCVKKSASHFGMAFQILDDLQDRAQDSKDPNSLNIANILGVEPTKKIFYQEIEKYNQTLKDLKLDNSDLSTLSNLVLSQAQNIS